MSNLAQTVDLGPSFYSSKLIGGKNYIIKSKKSKSKKSKSKKSKSKKSKSKKSNIVL